ncbi:LysE family transporter [Arthrobacter sp. MDT1-65]
MDVFAALGFGLVAGLALAIPLGAIGVLLVGEGAARGFRAGLHAAAAVATVDVLYATVAAGAGAALGPVLAAASPWPEVAGGLVLLALAVHGLRTARRTTTADPGADSARQPTGTRRFALFFGLTALNPATFLYFASLLTGLAGVTSSGDRIIAFVLGVGVSSLCWQAVLVALGGLLGRATGRGLRRITPIVGNVTIGALGLLIIVRALTHVP